MALRIMLLGVVASLGLELPSGPEVSCWTQSGRDWVHARLADLSGSVVEVDPPDSGPTACRQADAAAPTLPPAIAGEAKAPDDSAFVAASVAMAAEFAADSLTMREDRPPIEDAPAMLADAAQAVGLPDGEELAAQVTPDDEADPATVVESADVSDEEMTGTDEPSSRADRVSSALRLTREAVRAWADVIRESPDEACPAQ